VTGATPPDPGELRPIRPRDRRWMIVPVVVVVGLAAALVKPWGDDRAASPPSPTPPGIAGASAGATSPAPVPTAAPSSPSLPAAAEVIATTDIDAAPWANESAADAGGLWSWTDRGVVWRVDVATDGATAIDIGQPAGDASAELGARGIAVAGSQVWAADPSHRGLARIDPGTATVAERIELWPADAPGASGLPPGVVADPRASSSGFAIDGDSIFVPSIQPRLGDVAAPAPDGGELWRVDATTRKPTDWLTIDRPTGVAVGFGSVWVVSCCGSDPGTRTYSIVRLEKETGGIQASITLLVRQGVADVRPLVRIGQDSVWVGVADLGLVVRIDPATNAIRSAVPMDLPVSDLAVGADGSIWITEAETWYRDGAILSDRCDGALVRFDPVLESVVASTTLTCPMSVAVSGDDLWVGSAGTERRGVGGVPPRLLHMRATGRPD